ncbi:MAG: hypothetical protein KatS3mg121_0333 [Gammaproteobacteria bacterium]|nr:MAG: hypothetical protein KatS3mg121_0333 [Gammaproteobacteria bacterium]
MSRRRPRLDVSPAARLALPAWAGMHLTFDDGPDPDWTPRLLDLLERHGVRAAFFVLGRAARRAPALVRRAAAAGHLIGLHGDVHPHPRWCGAKRARREVLDGHAALADVLGGAPGWFRPPHGVLHPAMAEAAAELGLECVGWTLSAIDWGPLGRRAWIARRLARARPGDVVLLHDAPRRLNRPDQGLPALADWLARRASAQAQGAGR